MAVVLDHPSSALLVDEQLLRLLEEEVEVERLLRVLVELEEVPQLLAQLLAPLVPSPQAYSSRRVFGLHVGATVLVAIDILFSIAAVESPAPQLSVAVAAPTSLGISKESCTSQPACNLQSRKSFEHTDSRLFCFSLGKKPSDKGGNKWSYLVLMRSSVSNFQQNTSHISFIFSRSRALCNGMATNDALHLQSLLQEMKLSQLAKPVELTVFTDSSSGQALASKLGLTRRASMFSLDTCSYKTCLPMVIPAWKNHAAMLAKHLPASTLHKLLPKLGVRTKAADSKDLLSVFRLEMPASRKEQRSFFIGMMGEQPASAQLVAPSVASRTCQDSSVQEPRQEAASRDCQDSSLQEHSQEALQSLKASQRTSSRSSFAALMCANIFATVSFVSFKIYRLLLYAMLSFVQLSLL